jgi:hypothetical protein
MEDSNDEDRKILSLRRILSGKAQAFLEFSMDMEDQLYPNFAQRSFPEY